MLSFRSCFALAVAVFIAGFFAGCDNAGAPEPPGKSAGFEHRFSLKIAGKPIDVQVALSEIEKANGLMHRRKLGENEGMLFVFPTNDERSFWMRNVPINIALAYLTADGKIDEIFTLYAEDPSPVPSTSRQIRYVLEMPEKWFGENGVKPGDSLDLAGVRDAIKARGYAPEQFLPAQ